MSKLENISIARRQGIYPNIHSEDSELRIELDNNYYHAILIKKDSTACQLASDLHDLAERIRFQEFVFKKKEDNIKIEEAPTDPNEYNLGVSEYDPDFGGHDF